MVKLALAVVLVVPMPGCMQAGAAAPQQPAREVASQKQPIVNGYPTTSFPEVGQFWGLRKNPCTATLIGRRAIITAAHCFDYQTDLDGSTDAGIFDYDDWYAGSEIGRYISLGGRADNDAIRDIAVAELVKPADGFAVHPITTQFPSEDAVVSMLGYGCVDYWVNADGHAGCDRDSDFTLMQERDFYFSALHSNFDIDSNESGGFNLAVSGDSGGPVLDAQGNVIAITSRTAFTPVDGPVTFSAQQFANVPFMYSQIQNALYQLGIDE